MTTLQQLIRNRIHNYSSNIDVTTLVIQCVKEWLTQKRHKTVFTIAESAQNNLLDELLQEL